MSEQTMSLFNWTIKNPDWEIICPVCKQKIQLDSIENEKWQNTSKLKCNHNCSFEMDISWMWYKIKSTQVVDQLMMKVPHLNFYDAWKWVNIFKYNNPTYQFSQKIERDKAKNELRQILDLDRSWEKGCILSIGCSSGQELAIFDDYKNISSITCVDISKTILQQTVNKSRDNILSTHEKLNGEKIPIYYCEYFVENLPEELDSYSIEDGVLKEKNKPINKKYDLVLALKLFQSSYFDEFKLRRSLFCIARQMRSGGRLIVSIAKATVYISEDQYVTVNGNQLIDFPNINIVSGIYQSKGFINSFDRLSTIVHEFLFIGEFKNISVFYGDENSFEYYISCEKI